MAFSLGYFRSFLFPQFIGPNGHQQLWLVDEPKKVEDSGMSDFSPVIMALFYTTAGYMLVAGVTAGAVALMAQTRHNQSVYGSVAVLSLAGALHQVLAMAYYRTDDLVASARLLVLQHDCATVALAASFVLVAVYNLGFHSVSRWITGVALAALALMAGNHASPYSLHFQSVVEQRAFSSPLLHGLTYLKGHPGVGSALWNLLGLGVIAWLSYKCLPVWQQISRKKALMSASYLGLLVLGLLLNALVDWGLWSGIYLLGFSIAAFVVVVSVQMALDSARRARLVSTRERQVQSELLQRRKAEEKLRRLSQVFMQAPLPTHILDLEGRTLLVNDESISFLRRDASLPPKINFLRVLECLGLDRDSIVNAMRAGKVKEYGPYLFTAGVPVDSFFVVRDTWVKFRVYPLFNEAGELEEMVVRVEDVSEQQFVENAIRTISMAVSAETGHAFFTQIVVYLARLLNKKYVFIGLKKIRSGEPYIETLATAVDGDLSENFCYKLGGTPSDMVLRHGEFSVARQIQRDFPGQPMLQQLAAQSYLGSAILDEQRMPIGVLAVLDIKPMEHVRQLQQIVNIFVSRAGTELQRLQSEKTIRKMAYEDYLTGLPNRTALNEYVISLLHSEVQGVTNAFILLDLDHFKTINDALGHDVGDDVIRCLGKRLKQNIDPKMLVARIGGDEFAVVVSDLSENILDDVERISQRLTGLMQRPVQVGDHLLDVGCTMGVVLFPDSADTAIDVFRSADIALYKAKNQGRGGYQMFTPEMREAVSRRLDIEKGLRKALQHDELCLFYQPQMDGDGKLIGAEALIRWVHPKQGMISPMSFIPVAEESGLINVIGQWVIDKALKTRRAWSEQKVPFTGHLSVNVSAWQFARPDFVSSTIASIRNLGVPPSHITIEVTETSILTDIKETIEKLTKLRQFGVTIALDDFGTGYSSLAYLRDLPLDILKIDKAFVDILETVAHEPLLDSMITIGQNMGLEVVAEGVETPVQLERLKAMGCNKFQGYLFSKPLPEEAFVDWLNEQAGYRGHQAS